MNSARIGTAADSRIDESTLDKQLVPRLALATAILGFVAAVATLIAAYNLFTPPLKTVTLIAMVLFGVVPVIYWLAVPKIKWAATIANNCIPAALVCACGFAAIYGGGYWPLASIYAPAIPLLTVMVCGVRAAFAWSTIMCLCLLGGIFIGPLAENLASPPPWFALFGGIAVLIPTLISMLLHRRVWQQAVIREAKANAQLRDQFDRQRELDKRLSESDRAESLAQMAGRIAHDLNNFLTSVSGNAALAKLRLGEGDTARAITFVDGVEQAAADAGELARQLLNYSGKRHMTLTRIDAATQTQAAVSMARASLDNRAEIVVEASASPAIDGDPTQIDQIVINLVRNAFQAYDRKAGFGSSAQRPVTVTVKATHIAATTPTTNGRELVPGDYADIAVMDQAGTLQPDFIEKMFEPFVSTREEGRGLGLASVAGIVEAHGGGVVVEARPGSETTIQILIPVAPSLAGSQEETQNELREIGDRQHVLVADDHANVRNVMEPLLSQMGFQTFMATDGEDAVRLFNAHRDKLCAAVLDVSMPNKGGIETLAAIRAMDADFPVVLMSGYSITSSSEALRSDPRGAFLQKPFSADSLRKTLDGLIGAAA